MGKFSGFVLPQTFKDSPKATHFTSDYVIVCEKDLIVSSLGENYGIFKTPGGPPAGFNNAFAPWWIQGFETHGGIPTLDPFRAKTRRFWIATRDNTSPDIDTIIKPSRIDTNEQYHENNFSGPLNKGGLPVQMRVASTEDQNKKLNWDVIHGAAFYDGSIAKQVESKDNIYGHATVENIDFVVKKNNDFPVESVQNDNGIICALAGSFLSPSLSVQNLDVTTGENILEVPYTAPMVVQGFDTTSNWIAEVKLLKTGMPAWNNQEIVLQRFCGSLLDNIFNARAYPVNDEEPSAFVAGNPLKTAGAEDFEYNARGAYRDSTFALPTFASSQAIEAVDSLGAGFGASPSVYYADIDPVYNYLSSKYEEEMGTLNVHHTKLPNIYDKLSQLDFESDEQFPTFFGTNENLYWANYFSNMENPSSSHRKHNHVFITNKGNFSPSTVDEYKDNFPMYNNISFRSHSSDQSIMSALKNTGAEVDLFKSIVKHLFYHPEDGIYNIGRYISEEHKYSPYSADDSGGITNFRFKAGVEDGVIISEMKQNGQLYTKYNEDSGARLGVFNFDKWLENYPEDVDEHTDATAINPTAPAALGTIDPTSFKESKFNQNASMFISAHGSEKKKYKNPLIAIFESVFKKVELLPEITKVVKQKMRPHTEVFDGKKAYSEILFYRIQKRYASGGTIQNFWLENTPGVDVMRYVDTQIKYGEEYTYRIHAYTAVVGTKYKYSSHNPEIPRVIDYFVPSSTNNPLEYDLNYTGFLTDYWFHLTARKPAGYDWNQERILYPTDLPTHKQKKFEQYANQSADFQALYNIYYNAKSNLDLADKTVEQYQDQIDVLQGQMSTIDLVNAAISGYQQQKQELQDEIDAIAAEYGFSSLFGGPQIIIKQGEIAELDELIEKTMDAMGVAGIESGLNKAPIIGEILNLELLKAQTLELMSNVANADLQALEQLVELMDYEAELEAIYAYESANKDTDGGTSVPMEVASRVCAVSEPYVKIIEVPMFEETVSVVDNPPLAPHVTFNGFAGVNSRVMFSFDNTVGEEQMVPVILPGDDGTSFDKIRRMQDRDYTLSDTEYLEKNKSPDYVKQKITYKSDDYASQYQIFRKTKKPNSSSDFATTDMLGVVDTSTGASFIDNIFPNRKLYYMFRSVDRHGHVSNPTGTYQVEIVDDDGAIYLLISMIDYEKEKEKGRTNKPFKRRLQLDPAFLQTLINQNTTDFKDGKTAVGVNPELGILSDSIYDNKKFKVRVTSRSTGKKIDINLEFKKEMDEKSLLEQPDIY